MNIDQTAVELTGLAYDAALAPENWRPFMQRTARALNARSAGLRDIDYNAGQVRLFETVGFDPAFVTAYRQHFVRLDTLASAYLTMPIGCVAMGDEVVPWERQRKTEFGNDYMLAQNIRHLMGTILARDGKHHLLFGVQRELGQPAFDEEHRRLLGLIAPHVARAARIHRRMAQVTAETQSALSALDRLRVGVVLLDERGRPLFANREAERLAAVRGGFTVGREGLSLASTGDTARLRRLIADAAALAAGRGALGGGCLRTSPSGAAHLQLQVIPLPRGLSETPLEQSLSGGCVAVFVSPGGGAPVARTHRRHARPHARRGAGRRAAGKRRQPRRSRRRAVGLGGHRAQPAQVDLRQNRRGAPDRVGGAAACRRTGLINRRSGSIER